MWLISVFWPAFPRPHCKTRIVHTATSANVHVPPPFASIRRRAINETKVKPRRFQRASNRPFKKKHSSSRFYFHGNIRSSDLLLSSYRPSIDEFHIRTAAFPCLFFFSFIYCALDFSFSLEITGIRIWFFVSVQYADNMTEMSLSDGRSNLCCLSSSSC